MTSFTKKDDLYLKCDGCEKVVLVYKDQSDHLLVNDYIHDNNWATHKIDGKWKHFCQECEAFYRQKKREENI